MERKEAIEVVKKNWPDSSFTMLREALETLVPELKESEDERIRKWLIALIKSNEYGSISSVGKMPCSKLNVLAWLEKLEGVFSGPMDWNDYKDKPVEIWNAYQRGVVDGIDRGKNSVKNNPTDYGLEKQGEQKPNQEWSKEDERLFQIVIDILDRQNHLGNISRTDLIACVRKLKSLRPQNRWKPSEEMLEALYRAIPENIMEISEDEMLLDKLYQGLKYGRVLSKK